MADLLECLIQIKGVAGTPDRLSARVLACVEQGREDDAREVAGRLVIAEARFAGCLRAMLSQQEASALPALVVSSLDVDPGASLFERVEEFRAARSEVVRMLDGCTAEDLNRVGLEPSRGRMTVADLVATMLAHDTDQLGRLI